ncbi:MAG: hypothetical protein QM820_47015 [Minicystis sp.]
MNRGAALYYREPPSLQPVEEGGSAPNPWGRPPLSGTPHGCSFREAVDATYTDLAQHFEGWFRRARALSDTSARDKIREVTGIRMKLQRACLVRARLYLRDPNLAPLASRAIFDVFVYGTRAYTNYDRLRRCIYEGTKKRQDWIAKHEADPERIAAKRSRREDPGVKEERRQKGSNPRFKAAEALRKRMSYYGVDDPSKLPPKSPRGRKPKPPQER